MLCMPVKRFDTDPQEIRRCGIFIGARGSSKQAVSGGRMPPQNGKRSEQRSDPAKRQAGSAGVLYRPQLAYHIHLYLSRILQFPLDAPGDILRELERGEIVELLGRHEHADLATGRKRI